MKPTQVESAARLKRRIRALRIWAIPTTLLAALSLVVTVVQSCTAAHEIKTQQMVVVDAHGATRARLGVTGDGSTELSVEPTRAHDLDDPKAFAFLMTHSGDSVLSIWDRGHNIAAKAGAETQVAITQVGRADATVDVDSLIAIIGVGVRKDSRTYLSTAGVSADRSGGKVSASSPAGATDGNE